MVDSIEPGDVTRFNTRVPADRVRQDRIKGYMDDNMDGFLSDNARKTFANLIEDRRLGDDDGGIGENDVELDGDTIYDSETGRWRTPKDE